MQRFILFLMILITSGACNCKNEYVLQNKRNKNAHTEKECHLLNLQRAHNDERLVYAIKNHDFNEIKKILRDPFIKLFNRYSSYDGKSMIDHICETRNEQIINCFLKSCEGQRYIKSIQYTPLHVAVLAGNEALVKSFLQRESSLELESGTSKGSNLLHLAVRNLHPDIVKILLESGANPDVIEKTENTPNRRVKIHSASIDILQDELAPLHWAVQKGCLETVTLLLNYNAQVDLKNKHGETPLYIAVEQGNLRMVEMLLNRGASVNAETNWGTTALYAAVLYRRKEIVDLLIDGKADVKKEFMNKETLLHIAARQGYHEIVKILINRGAEVDALDSMGNTPLHESSHYLRTGIIKILCDSKADAKVKNRNGNTPLHLAAKYFLLPVQLGISSHQFAVPKNPSFEHCEKVVKTLMLHGADVNALNHDQHTPLQLAENVNMQKALSQTYKEDAEMDLDIF